MNKRGLDKSHVNFDILVLLNKSQEISNIIDCFISYSDRQWESLNNYIESGQCPANQIQPLLKEQRNWKEAISALILKNSLLDKQTSKIINDRSNLPLVPISHDEYSSHTFQMFSTLQFMEPQFISAHNFEKFSALVLNRKEFEAFSNILQASLNPNDLIEYVHQLLHLSDEINVVLVCKDVRNGGFTICPHTDNIKSQKYLEKESECNPTHISRLEEGKCWNYNSNGTNPQLIPNFFSHFDIWVDIHKSIIYAKDSLFPIRICEQIEFKPYPLEELEQGLLFFKLDKAIQFKLSTVIKALQANDIFHNPHNISIYDGMQFKEFNFDECSSFSELILLNYMYGETNKLGAIFNIRSNELIATFSVVDADYQLLLNLFSYNLTMLNISGYLDPIEGA